MVKPCTGAVKRENVTKYDILRTPRVSLLVFCQTSDYQYPVMNVIYSGIYGTVTKLNQNSIYQSQTINIMEIMELDDTLSVLNPTERKFTDCCSNM